MIFMQGSSADPGLHAELNKPWTLSYNKGSRSRFVGLASRGIGIINTSNPQENGGGFLGSVILALDTRRVRAGDLAFTAGTNIPNPRKYALRLMYRIGDSGPFRDFPDSNGEPIEYRAIPNSGHEQRFEDLSLPEEILGKAYVQLKWRYYYTEIGTGGPRSKLRLGDVKVRADHQTSTWMFR